MKITNSRRVNRIGQIAKYMMIGGAAAAFLGLSLNAQAQSCTVGNWTAHPGLTDADTGFQGSDNRRYGGPCGLRVPFDGTNRFVTFESGQGEVDYIARFYAFLDNVGSDPVIIFAGEGNGADQVQVWYNFPSANDLTLRVFDQGGGENDLTVANVGSGWHSVEFEWHQGASAGIQFLVNSEDPADELSMTVDTSGLVIESAHLGNVDGASTGGSADFDDFDSRRSTRPGRLVRGDANDDGLLDIFDVQSAGNEVVNEVFAPGQPDCNEDGTIDIFDVQCIGGLVVGS